MADEAVGDDFHDTFAGESHCEDDFNFFLKHETDEVRLQATADFFSVISPVYNPYPAI